MNILVADDSATARLLLSRDLEELGHTCLLAEDGAQAWELFKQHGAEVVISDWMMPDKNGDELCQALRSEPIEPYTYFIMLTSIEDRSFVLKAIQAGADDFLTKPFTRYELEARLITAERVTALHNRLADVQKLTPTLAGGVEVTPQQAGGPGRLLVVEDDALQAQMIKGMLELSLLRHHSIVHVSTLAAARRYLSDSRVACVLLDLTLPDASELDGLVAIRNVAPDVPVVVVTADSDAARAIKAVQAGAQDYLIKGRIDGEQLGRAVTYAVERQRSELAMAYHAFHDSLTGLPNRDLFLDRLTRALAQSARKADYIAVLFIDLDGFKQLNDTHGHNVGDSVLRAVAARLLSSMRPGDTVARFGGDEFTVVAIEVAGREGAAGIASRVIEAIEAPLSIGDIRCDLRASVGVVVVDSLIERPDDIIARADAAMYEAKRTTSGYVITRP